MFGIHFTNPDESLFASIAWTLWTEGRLATDLLSGAIPGIETHVYWTPPLYYLVLAVWLGLWGLSLLSVRMLSMVLALGVLALLWRQGHRHALHAAWIAPGLALVDPFFGGAASMGRMDGLAIFLITATLVVVDGPLSRRRAVLSGVLAAAAMLTHPLGAAAAVGAGVTTLVRQRGALLPMLAGAAPLLLLWGLYIAADVDSFVAQMGLQLARKSGHPFSPVDNLQRFANAFGPVPHAAVLLWVGGGLGLALEARRYLPWLVAVACLWPVILMSGELAYPAYLVPASALGLQALVARRHWAPWLVAGAVSVRLATVLIQPAPLGGIPATYSAYCRWLEPHLGRDNLVMLATVPDPWFELRHRDDLRFRHAPPVPIEEADLHDYVGRADVILTGGYNPPGFVSVFRNWDAIGTRGQRLWIVQENKLFDYDKVRGNVELRD